MDQTVLVISSVFPYPLHDGGRVDVYYRLKALKELGVKVYLITFYNPSFDTPDSSPLKGLCEAIFSIPYLRRKLSKIFAFKPYSVGSKENIEAIQTIINELQGIRFDAIIAESHHVLTVADFCRHELNIPILNLRAHNNEPRFMYSLAQTSSIFSIEQLFFLSEAIKYKHYENRLFSLLKPCDTVWHISFDEHRKYKQKYPHLSQKIIPAGIDVSEKIPFVQTEKKRVLFVGALFSPNNLHGLKWYIRNVHPKILKKFPDYTLVVAGNTKGANLAKLQQLFQHLTHFEFIDTPENLDPLYKSSMLFINPMRYGAGVKLKTIQAALKGVPIVSTSCGNEGTGFEHNKHILVCDTPSEFIQSIENLFLHADQRGQIAKEAAHFLDNNYNQKEVLKTV